MIAAVILALTPMGAPGYTADDTFAAIRLASRDTGVSQAVLTNIIGCETGWTFYPYTEGDHGHSHGVAQINDFGNARPKFYQFYEDVYNPYEATYFMAETLAGWHPPLGRHTWNC